MRYWKIVVKKWYTIKGGAPDEVRKGKYLKYTMWLSESSKATGAGTNCEYTYEQMFPGNNAVRVVLGLVVRGLLIGKVVESRSIIRIHEEISPSLPHTMEINDSMIQNIKEILGEQLNQEWDIYVDGSYKKIGGNIKSIMDEEEAEVEAGASLVFVKRVSDWYKYDVYQFRVHGARGHRIKSGFDMKLVGLTYACLVQRELDLNAIIFTDCEAAMKSLGGKSRMRYWSNKSDHLLLFAGTSAYRSASVYKVKGHPERTEVDCTKWTRHILGNHMADIGANCHTTGMVKLCLKMNFVNLSITNVLKSISLWVPFFWGDQEGMPVLETYTERVNRVRLAAYLVTRDKYRAARGLPSKWSGRTVKFAARLWELQRRGKADVSRMIRICWDWYQHGGNIRKQDRSNRGLCKLCKCEDSQEHWMSMCQNLGAVEIMNRTRERVQKAVDAKIIEQPDAFKFGMKLLELSARPGSGYMVKMGFYSQSDLNNMSKQFPEKYLETEWKAMETIAVEMGLIWVEGIERLYAHKIHNGLSPPNEEYYAKKNIDRLQRIKTAKMRKEEKIKRKPSISKEKSKDDYKRLYDAIYTKKTLLSNGCVRTGVG